MSTDHVNWPYFIGHALIATFVLVLAVTWAYWLWFMIYRPARWAEFVRREHVVMRVFGLPERASCIMYSWQVGWVLKALVALTIALALLVLHLL